MRKDTSTMGVSETFDYLLSQQSKGYPGSVGIHPNKKKAKADEALAELVENSDGE